MLEPVTSFSGECSLISLSLMYLSEEGCSLDRNLSTVPSIGGGCGTLCIEHTTAFFGGATVLHKPGEHMVCRMECGAYNSIVSVCTLILQSKEQRQVNSVN